MTTHSAFPLTALTTSFAFLLAACSGATTSLDSATTSPESGGVGTGTSSEGPRPSPDHGSLTEACDGNKGLTGNSVLDALDALALPSSAKLRRYTSASGYPNPSTTVGVKLSVRYVGGDVRCRRGAIEENARRNPGIVTPEIGVVVSVDFSTDDGQFDEHVTGLLSREPESRQLHLTAEVPISEVHGTYRAVAQTDEAGSAEPLLISGLFEETAARSGGGVKHGAAFSAAYRFDW